MLSPSLLALITAISMAGGQLLFKIGSATWTGNSLLSWATSFIKNPYLMCAVLLYAATILIWIYVLKHLPLSIAYPITALSYIIVPVFSYFILQEKITPQIGVGSLFIICGIALTSLNTG